MVLYLKLNNNSVIGETDAKVVDLSASSNNGTVTTAVFEAGTGILGDGSFKFLGTGDRILLATTSNISNNFTISLWFKTPQNNTNEFIFFQGTGTNSNARQMFIYTEANTKMGAGTANGSSNSVSHSVSTYKLNDWNHVVFIRNDTRQILYLNGKLEDIDAIYSPLYQGTVSYLSANGNGGDSWFNGSIDEVIVYNVPLTSLEVSNLYNDYLGCIPETGFIDCSLNCTLNDNYFISENLTMSGTGHITLNGNFTFNGTNQYMFQNQGCEFRINRGGGIL